MRPRTASSRRAGKLQSQSRTPKVAPQCPRVSSGQHEGAGVVQVARGDAPTSVEAGAPRDVVSRGSSHPSTFRQKRPVFRQHFLKPATGAAGTRIVPTQLLRQVLVPVNDAIAAFDLRLARESAATLTRVLESRGGLRCRCAVAWCTSVRVDWHPYMIRQALASCSGASWFGGRTRRSASRRVASRCGGGEHRAAVGDDLRTIMVADWGKAASKRAVYEADVATRRVARVPSASWSLGSLLAVARQRGEDGGVLVAMDLVLGVPTRYFDEVRRVDRWSACAGFLPWLPALHGEGEFWSEVKRGSDWSVTRPFFAIPRGTGARLAFQFEAGYELSDHLRLRALRRRGATWRGGGASGPLGVGGGPLPTNRDGLRWCQLRERDAA